MSVHVAKESWVVYKFRVPPALQSEPSTFDQIELERAIASAEKEERWRDVVDHLSRLSQIYGDTLVEANVTESENADLEYRLGQTWERRLGRLDRALYHYQRAILRLAPNGQALYAARNLYHRLGDRQMVERLDDLARAQNIEVITPKGNDDDASMGMVNLASTASDVHIEQSRELDAAELRLLSLMTSNLALHEIAQEALAIAKLRDSMAYQSDLAKERACVAYQRVLELNPTSDEATEWLTHYYRSEKEFVRLDDHLRSLRTENHEKWLENLRLLAQILEQDAGDADKAFRVLAEAVRIDLDNENIHEQLLALADRTAQIDRLVALYQDLIAHAEDSNKFVQLELRVGRILLARQAHENAAEYFRAVLNVQPTNREAQRELRALYVAMERWDHLADLLETILRHPESNQSTQADGWADGLAMREATIRELADLYEHRLHDVRRAAAALGYLAVNDARLDEATLWRSYQLYRSAQNWDALAATGQQILRSFTERGVDGTDLRRFTLEVELAQVYADHLNQPGEAIALFESAIRAYPGRHDVATLLENLYESQGAWDTLIAHLTYRDEHADLSSEQRHDVLFRLGSLWERQGQRERAIQVLLRALQQDTDARADEIEETLCRLWIADGLVEQAANLLQERIVVHQGRGASAAELTASYVRMARIIGTQRGYETVAENALLEAVNLQPNNREPNMLLADLYRQRSDWRRFAEYWEKLAQIDRASPARSGLVELLSAAKLLSSVGEHHGAVALYQQALQADASCIEAIDSLLHLSVHFPEQQEHWLLRRCELAATPQEIARLVTDLASLRRRRATRLADHYASLVSLYEKAIQSDPTYSPAVRGLSEMHRAVGHVELSIATIQKFLLSANHSSPSSELADLYIDLEALFAESAQSDAGAEYLVQLSSHRPDDPGICVALGISRYRSHQWSEALRYFRMAVQRVQDLPLAIGATAFCYAGHCELHLERHSAARQCFEHALRIDAHHLDSIKALIQLVRGENQPPRLADLLVRLSRTDVDMNTRTGAMREAAELYWKVLGDRAKAAEFFNELLEQGQLDEKVRLELYPAVLPLLREAGYRASAAHACDELVEIVSDPDQQTHYRLQAGADYEAAGDGAQAANRWRTVLENKAPRHQSDQAIAGLLRRLQSKHDYQGIIRLLEPYVRDLPPPLTDEQRQAAISFYEILLTAYGQLNDDHGQIGVLEARLVLGEDDDLRVRLADLYQGKAQYQLAALRNHQVLARNLRRIDSLRSIAAVVADRHPYHAYMVYRVLHLFEEGSAEERAFCEKIVPAQVHSDEYFPGELTEAERDSLVMHPDAKAQEDILSAIAWAAPLLWPSTPDAWGIDAKALVTPSRQTYLGCVYGALIKAQQIKRANLYLVPDADEDVRICASSPPAVIVSERFVQAAPLSVLRFCLARAFELTRGPYILAAGLNAEDFNHLLSLITTTFGPSDHRTTALTDRQREHVETIRRKLPFKLGRQLHQLLQRQPDLQIDQARWRKAVMISGNRMGLVFSGDLEAALARVISEDQRVSDSLPLKELSDISLSVRDLLSFAASDAYYQCRTKLGVTTEL